MSNFGKPIKLLDTLLEKGYKEGIFNEKQVLYFAENMPKECNIKNNLPIETKCDGCEDFKEFCKNLIKIGEKENE